MSSRVHWKSESVANDSVAEDLREALIQQSKPTSKSAARYQKIYASVINDNVADDLRQAAEKEDVAEKKARARAREFKKMAREAAKKIAKKATTSRSKPTRPQIDETDGLKTTDWSFDVAKGDTQRRGASFESMPMGPMVMLRRQGSMMDPSSSNSESNGNGKGIAGSFSIPPPPTPEKREGPLGASGEVATGALRAGDSRGPALSPEDMVNDPKAQRAVLFYVTVHSIYSLDLVESKFSLDVEVHMFWYEPSLRRHWNSLEDKSTLKPPGPSGGDGDGDYEVNIPTLVFQNCKSSLDNIKDGRVRLPKRSPPGVLHYSERIRGDFHQVFHLACFPYDVQVCSIVLRIDSSSDMKLQRFAAHMVEKGAQFRQSVKMRPDVTLEEWRLYKPAGIARLSDLGNGKKRADFTAFVVLRRRHEYYTRSVTPTVLALSGCGLSTFVISPAEFADRASVVLTLMLTMITFRFSFDEMLPKVNYKTWLESYLTDNFWFLVLIFVVNACATVCEHSMSSDERAQIDRYFMIVSVVTFVALEVRYGWGAFRYLKGVTAALGDEINSREADFPLEVQRRAL